jgi:hypothetical protein
VSDLFSLFDDAEPEGGTAPLVRERPSEARPARPDPAEGRKAAAPRRALSVSELSAEIRSLLEGEIGERLVEGEVSNCRLWNTGHRYCPL